uniref:Uncharacterized protein n=1 Tax=viral metagenome TaxID=1070528 RepID=A0A6M3Y200_9ZZZZ
MAKKVSIKKEIVVRLVKDEETDNFCRKLVQFPKEMKGWIINKRPNNDKGYVYIPKKEKKNGYSSKVTFNLEN